MLSKEDNDLLTRVGPGTAMGELMRQYWVPALPAAEFPSPDSPPKRMKLLGENLVMFRDSNGNVGCFKESCPHRGASMFFGRNEEGGLRCVYHGWKFDTTGACIDMPSEPAESNFKNKVRITNYPARDVNHMVWVYMGHAKEPPPFPEFEINTIPAENVAPPSIMMEEANWMQNLGRPRQQPPRLPPLSPRRVPPAPVQRAGHGAPGQRPVLPGVGRQDAAPGRPPDGLRRVLQRPPRLG
jgi:nitrite reductase/ring-hydroxylating ferredoxin subunit